MVSVENNSILKKISAVIVMITALVFFSFNVFADTPVQPLQVITYSDTTTNVRISGTAERLHYNVDSFQVVFMNPPNNYGTACTPVLVSFRFYNSSELPAYVGQAEFELTATNGTGAVNTIIYGYDQISTDLFVAESSYSTSEVGRIGIGASNDFAYYTGFVIPPKTSLYFSCIVYVNASAYGQNNTGATEDVNQVTLSALNLYTNQLSFSEDYPYHNQPIDFTDIIDEISNLSSTVSTSSEMQSLINAVSYIYQPSSHTVTNTTYANLQTNTTLLSSNGVEVVSLIRPSINFIDTSVQYNDYLETGLINSHQYIDVVFDHYLMLRNTNANSAYSISYGIFNLRHNITKPSQWSYVTKFVEECDDSNINYMITAVGTSVDLLRVSVNQRMKDNYAKVWLYPDSVQFVHIKYHRIYRLDQYSQNASYDYGFSFNDTTVVADNKTLTAERAPAYDSYIFDKNIAVNRILEDFDIYIDTYNSVNGVDDSSDISNDVADVSDSNHIIEESYYSANASAIEATGLSNYRFSNEQNNGIGKVADDFMLLWNALGSWNGVYIFSLTMALATFIMRHGGLFTIKRETSDKGGED